DEPINETGSQEQLSGDTLATVNGEEITSEDVSEIQESVFSQGQEIPEEQAIELLVNQKVLEQKAQEEEITVSDEEVESSIEEQLSPQGATLEDYKEQLKAQGISYDEHLEILKKDFATEKFLYIKLEGENFEVSEEEAREYYNMYASQSPEEEVPSYEEMEEQIVANLEQQKRQEAIENLIQDFKSDADIEYE
ncbi:MAG: SurA N-terminal domain-containing protein, partial [Nanoarchaeota archaeon]